MEPMPHRTNRFGWQPDLPDYRDFSYGTQRLKLEAPRALPGKMDLRNAWMPEPYHQRDLGSCTANAIGAALAYEHAKQGLGKLMPSRLFIYYAERAMEGTVQSDPGAQIRDGIKVIAKLGAPPERLWPYDIAKFARKPPVKAYRAALQHRALAYFRVDQARLRELLGCLAGGFPFVFGFTVYEGFDSPKVLKSGILDMPRRGERVLGGHAVVAVGYNQKTKRFLVRNSYGAAWGRKGYFTMPFDYLLDDDLAADFWTIRTVS
jgi:C1A family cysteine protease